MKIIHIITSLSEGGAQSLLNQFIKADCKNKHIVIPLLNNGRYINIIRERGIKVIPLSFNSFHNFIKSIIQIKIILKKESPDLIHSWLYHANLVSSFLFLFNPKLKVVWSIHNFSVSLKSISFKTLIIVLLNSFFSYFIPKKIIFASNAAINSHLKIKFDFRKIVLIKNGIDTEIYKPSKYKKDLKSEIGIKGKTIFAMIARFDKAKDHINLFEALRLLKLNNENWFLLLIGENMDQKNKEIISLINKAGIKELTQCLGIRKDICYILNGIDFLVLSSLSEDQPMILIEAMSCGKLCISTDVGSSSIIIDQFGWIVPKSNPKELFKCLLKVMKKDQYQLQLLSKQARKHIKDNFSINNMIEDYNSLYLKIKN